eukprot:CAMPEP_0206054616 /NCGR_PEP_ID=MMETSP1466-20131121/38451_1 /ASSEMBLY_ACC=CAM_ASM_001126 /TAXON_ID=44452 /ORGANISM="Pavlova gyrans, Strain CCMP608" /LENGTH=116 /DNA_ID=CAMNT_0053429827 /DNA_START=10 /DNA_END=358 /DNA_ORIENTATION=+
MPTTYVLELLAVQPSQRGPPVVVVELAARVAQSGCASPAGRSVEGGRGVRRARAFLPGQPSLGRQRGRALDDDDLRHAGAGIRAGGSANASGAAAPARGDFEEFAPRATGVPGVGD